MPEWLQILLAVGSPIAIGVATIATVRSKIHDLERRQDANDRDVREATKNGEKALTILEEIRRR